MEPHCVGLLCACSIYHLTGEAGRAVDFPGLRLLASPSLISLVSEARPGLQASAWTPTPFPPPSSELSSSRSADHQHYPPSLYTATSGLAPRSPSHIAIIQDLGLLLRGELSPVLCASASPSIHRGHCCFLLYGHKCIDIGIMYLYETPFKDGFGTDIK